jgi:seryl-tRNA synthetase
MQKYLFYLFYSLKMLINQGFSNPPEQNRCAERMCYIVTDKELSQRAKDYFAQIRKTDRLIKRLTDTVFTLRSSLTSQSYELNPDKVQTSGPKNTLEETVAKIVDLEADINRRIDELVDMKLEAFTMINRIPDLDQQNILIGRYIQLKKWEDIALELNFSIQWVYELHGKGLLAFSQANSEFFRNREKQSATA